MGEGEEEEGEKEIEGVHGCACVGVEVCVVCRSSLLRRERVG